MKLKSLKKNYKKIEGKTVFLRVDFNVPISNSKIKEDFKINQSLETINFLLKHKCKIILASHLGQPEKSYDAKFSLSPIAKHLSRILSEKIFFLDFKKYNNFKIIKKEIQNNDAIFLLDNLRFNSGESRNCKKLGKSLASLADIYVNDAFAVSHRANSSVSSIRYNKIPSFMGLLLEKEINNLNKILNPKKPFCIVMGGAKISSKVPIIKKLYKKADYILLGGALVNNFYLAQGFSVGKSLLDKKGSDIVKTFIKSKKIILPIDLVVKTEINKKKSIIRVKKVDDISENDCILDIGPESILMFSRYIDKSQTIVWNGPMGMFEDPNFKKGTVVIARKIASRSKGRAFGVAGGGETVEALSLSGMKSYMDWVSTGGGAMLEYLSGEDMPGIN